MVADIEIRLEVGSPAKTRFMPSVGVSGLVGSYEVFSRQFREDSLAFGDRIHVLRRGQQIISILMVANLYMRNEVCVETLNPPPSFCSVQRNEGKPLSIQVGGRERPAIDWMSTRGEVGGR